MELNYCKVSTTIAGAVLKNKKKTKREREKSEV